MSRPARSRLDIPQEIEKPCVRKTPTKRRDARGVQDGPFRLDAAALWKRLSLLNRSQNWLAREVGISPGYLSTLVNEGRAPSGRIRRRMQKTLGVNNFQELFRLEDSDDG